MRRISTCRPAHILVCARAHESLGLWRVDSQDTHRRGRVFVDAQCAIVADEKIDAIKGSSSKRDPNL